MDGPDSNPMRGLKLRYEAAHPRTFCVRLPTQFAPVYIDCALEDVESVLMV